MYRRFLVTSLRRSVVLLVLICLGCSAQSVPSEVAQRIERQVRSFYSIPAGVKINLSPLKPSDFLHELGVGILCEIDFGHAHERFAIFGKQEIVSLLLI